MAIDLKNEEVMPLAKALRQAGYQSNPSTAWRWCKQGVRGVKLEYLRAGRRIVTSVEAIQRFSDRLTQLDHDADNYVQPANNHRAYDDAEEAEAVAEGL